MVVLLWAAWTVEAGPRGDLSSRGGGMPDSPVAAGTTGSPRGGASLSVEAAEIPQGRGRGGGYPAMTRIEG